MLRRAVFHHASVFKNKNILEGAEKLKLELNKYTFGDNLHSLWGYSKLSGDSLGPWSKEFVLEL